MEDHELEAYLADLETDRVERKASLTDRDTIRQAICAFANDLPAYNLPGILFIGAHDNGAPSNIAVTDELLLSLADMRSDGNIVPFPSITVQKRCLNGSDMAVITVQPADAPPVRFKGRTYIRVGPRKAIATPEEERRLSEKRRWRDLPFDIRPVLSSTIDDLNLNLFRETYLPAAVSVDVLQANNRSLNHQLMSLRMITPEPDSVPTTLGILTLGKEPERYIPGAYIQFLRLSGTELSSPIVDEKVLTGALPDVLRRLDELIQINITTNIDIVKATTEARHPDYPYVALQQVTRNALMHRTYEGTSAPVRVIWFADRVEVISPGGTFGQVNADNFGQPGITDYRNQNLAAALRDLGYVQRFGVGIALARSEMRKNGNPAPDFNVGASFVAVTLWKEKQA